MSETTVPETDEEEKVADKISEEEKDTKPEKEYVELTVEYTVFPDGEAEVTGYSGKGNRATIDSKYEGNRVIRIAESAFEDCSTLEAVLFWADIEEIGDSAFKNCTALEEVDIPGETNYIGAHAFENCAALTHLIIWGNSDIGDYAFASCHNIEEISISGKTKSVGAHAFENCTGATSLIIWGAESIGDYAFAGCIGIQEVDFPHNVISVGAHAFDGCTGLTSVMVWDDDTEFGKNAFLNCPNLKDKPVENDMSEVIENDSDPSEKEPDTDETEKIPEIQETKMEEITKSETIEEPETKQMESVNYSTNGKDTVENGNTGIYKWKNRPNHLIVEDNDHFESDFYTTDLAQALKRKDIKTIHDY